LGSATAGAKTQRSHNEKYKTRQLSDDPMYLMSHLRVPAIFTYYRKEQAQVGGRALTDAWSEPGYPLTMHS
jgi:hypothetical protein